MKTQLNTALLASATLIALSALAAGPAAAGTPATTSTASMVVRYHDLDLSTRGGIQTLYRRIETAAWHVCGQLDYIRTEGVRCQRALTETAVKEVNLPALSALHSGKGAPQLTVQR